RLFRGVILLDAAAVGIGASAGGAAVLILALRERGHLALLPWTLACLAVCMPLGLARRHAKSISDLRELPYFLAEDAALHAGRERDVRVVLYRPQRTYVLLFIPAGSAPQPVAPQERALWSAPDSVRVHAELPGDVPFVARGTRGPVTMETRLTAHAHA